ncbi:hypothetical protein AB6A40_010861 [Gnathostoma spinigerum]|uniref:Uncharacterized protein n=1 Tax=Gnathostoma spinigerum TaxID=75299 RepID=A0ABD6F366_9BILA
MILRHVKFVAIFSVRLRIFVFSATTAPTVPTALHSSMESAPFTSLKTTIPDTIDHLEPSFVSCLREVNTFLNNSAAQPFVDNLNKEQRNSLRSLQHKVNNQKLRISVSDEGGCFIVPALI